MFHKAPWQIIWRMIPVATPHVGALWMAFFASQLQGHQIQKNTNSHNFAQLENRHGQYFLMLPNNATAQNLIFTSLNIGNM